MRAARNPEPAGLRVLYVTPRYLPFAGGVENHVAEVARRMARWGVSTTVLATDPDAHLPPEETLDGVRVRRVRSYPSGRDYYFAPALYGVITRGKWDLVHVQSYHTFVAPMTMLAARRAGLPYVVTFHGGGNSSRVRNGLRRAQRRLLRPLLSRAARLIALADFEVEFLSRELGLTRRRFAVIPNGSDLPRPDYSPPPQNGETLIASVGRLERYKGHHRAIAALPLLLDQVPDARLWIAGAGPYEQALRRQAEKLGVSDRVEIQAIPPADRKRMASALSRTSLMVLFSEYETHPIAVLEALSMGRPALVTDNSGLHELVERGWARGVPPESTPAQIVKAMVEQLRRPTLPGKIKLSTWDECAGQLLDLYRSILESPECAS